MQKAYAWQANAEIALGRQDLVLWHELVKKNKLILYSQTHNKSYPILLNIAPNYLL